MATKTLMTFDFAECSTKTALTWTLDETNGVHTVKSLGIDGRSISNFETTDVMAARRAFRRQVAAATRYILDPRCDQRS